MFRRLLIPLLLFLACASWGQISNPSVTMKTFAGAPTGTCSARQLAVDTTTGNLYACNAGTWKLAGGGGITNGAANNVIPKSNGTNLVTSAVSDNGTSVTTSEPILLPLGTSGSPAINFSGDLGTGIFDNPQTLTFVTSGAGTVAGMGTGSIPTFTVPSNGTLGISANTAVSNVGDVAFSRGGANIMQLGVTAGNADTSGTLNLKNLNSLGTAGVVAFNTDTGFSRLGAASAALGNGTASNFSGNLKLTTLTFADATTMTTAAHGTVTNTGGNLTANSVVLGAGTADTKVLAGFSTDGLTQLNIGPVDTTNNGILGLNGKTSGTATFTAPAVAGTRANPILISNAISWPTGTSGVSLILGPSDATFNISANQSNGGLSLNSKNNTSQITIADTATGITLKNVVQFNNKIASYNTINTVDNGVPSELGHLDLVTQSAAIAATTICTPSATGRFRISVYEKVTTVGSVSSILGGATGTVLTYTDGTDSVAQSISMGLDSQAGVVGLTNNANTTTTSLNGTAYIYAKTGVAIQLAVGYTSVNAGEMVFALRATCEAL